LSSSLSGVSGDAVELSGFVDNSSLSLSSSSSSSSSEDDEEDDSSFGFRFFVVVSTSSASSFKSVVVAIETVVAGVDLGLQLASCGPFRNINLRKVYFIYFFILFVMKYVSILYKKIKQ